MFTRDRANFLYYKYFSIPLGIPITCQGTACDTTLDNKLFSTAALVERHELDPAFLSVSNFPTKNSEIVSHGMSEKTVSPAYTSPNIANRSFDYISSINPVDGTSTISTANGSTDSVTSSRTTWQMTRGNPVRIIAGGSYNTSATDYEIIINGILYALGQKITMLFHSCLEIPCWILDIQFFNLELG